LLTNRPPLVVDLDGTLIKTDLLAETASQFLVDHPWHFFKLLIWLVDGKGALKSHLAQTANVDVASLPYNEELLTWLRAERGDGRTIVLATASHQVLANKIAAHVDLFDDVLATDNATNLKGDAKRDALVARYGLQGFDYVGNDWPDVPVWRFAAKAHVVSASTRLIETARGLGNLGVTMNPGKPAAGSTLLRAMRPHQWTKNLLVFIPLLAAHQYGDAVSVMRAILAFIVFGLIASSVYLLNDIIDVTDDRHHQRKRSRPFAAGNLSLIYGWMAWPMLTICAFVLAGPIGGLSWHFIVALTTYFLLTMAYSLRLKKAPIVDVLTLALLYTLRIFAGAAAIAVPLSFWLLTFSMFIFLSLAFIKRYSELRAARDTGEEGVLRGRGYDPQDLELVSSLGGSAGYTAVLVLALYIQDVHTANLYATPMLIWLVCPLLLFWVSRVWLIAHRGNMHDDPIVFAIKDRISWLVGTLVAAIFVLAKVVS
jgi:4-hydroxybenzoate polyprenyltransferase